jgi:hypothetical protein
VSKAEPDLVNAKGGNVTIAQYAERHVEPYQRRFVESAMRSAYLAGWEAALRRPGTAWCCAALSGRIAPSTGSGRSSAKIRRPAPVSCGSRAAPGEETVK